MTSVSCRRDLHRYGAAVNLKSARQWKGLTQAALAAKVGISVRTLIRCEVDDKLPQNRLSRQRYCRILGLRER